MVKMSVAPHSSSLQDVTLPVELSLTCIRPNT